MLHFALQVHQEAPHVDPLPGSDPLLRLAPVLVRPRLLLLFVGLSLLLLAELADGSGQEERLLRMVLLLQFLFRRVIAVWWPWDRAAGVGRPATSPSASGPWAGADVATETERRAARPGVEGLP